MLLVNPSGCLLFAVPKQVYFVPEFVQHQPNHADNIIIYLDDTDNTVHLGKECIMYESCMIGRISRVLPIP